MNFKKKIVLESEDEFMDTSEDEKVKNEEEVEDQLEHKEIPALNPSSQKISDLFKPSNSANSKVKTESMKVINNEKFVSNSEQFVENLPWVEKYRPIALSEMISQNHIVGTIKKLIEDNKLPHLLFYGPPGTGKTSTILAIARMIYGKNYSSMILELNASDDRGIEVVRQQIKDFANTKNIFSSGIKLIVLDEADQMTNAAQAALRRIIEKYTKSTRFCLICNYLNKIIPALQSRCTRFRFAPLKDEDVIERLKFIIKSEGVKVSDNGMEALVRLGHGDMRKSLNILQVFLR